MPHQCTTCGHTFPDGSKQMLSGCPECGGNKFQFLPADAVEEASSVDATPETSEPPSPDTTSGSGSDIIDADAEAGVEAEAPEDHAQASARRTLASEDELPPVEDVDPDEPDEEERPDLAELRRELNEQFESIKILQRGEYELNLMELYDREEYIIAIEEDGRYVIDVPSVSFEDS